MPMKAFDDYGNAVCTFVRHATAKEKEAIRKELADHMEDHAQALMDGGYPEDHAVRAALESMGIRRSLAGSWTRSIPVDGESWLPSFKSCCCSLEPTC